LSMDSEPGTFQYHFIEFWRPRGRRDDVWATGEPCQFFQERAPYREGPTLVLMVLESSRA
jgi:hypothetical protein